MTKENPLLPNRYLRDLYAAMAKLQMIEEAVQSKKARGRADGTRGEEACVATVLLALEAGDLLAEARPSAATRYLLGARLREVLGAARNGGDLPSVTTSDTKAKLLPWIEDGLARVQSAMGAAMALQSQGSGRFAAVFVGPGDIAGSAWRDLLKTIGKTEAPLLVVLLPTAAGEANGKAGKLSARSIGWGVPGIPIEAGDAIALSRVVQESTGRLRGGGGPVLMECLEIASGGKKRAEATDPVVTFGKTLLDRGVILTGWAEKLETSFRKQMAARIAG